MIPGGPPMEPHERNLWRMPVPCRVALGAVQVLWARPVGPGSPAPADAPARHTTAAFGSGATGSAATNFHPRTSKKKPVLLGIAGVFVLYVLAASFLIDEPATRTNRNGVEVMSPGALSTVCEGKGGAEGTKAYDPDSDHHTMQVALRSASGWSRMNPPYYYDGFHEEPAAEVELVGCYTRGVDR